jgi:hypothetical protein
MAVFASSPATRHHRRQPLLRWLGIALLSSFWLAAHDLHSAEAFTLTNSNDRRRQSFACLPSHAAASTRTTFVQRLHSTTPPKSKGRGGKSSSGGGGTAQTSSSTVVVDELKAELYDAVMRSPKEDGKIRVLVNQICAIAASSSSRGDPENDDDDYDPSCSSTALLTGRNSNYWLSGEWELLYGTDEITRSSPFFTAFRQAFPDSADQIFGITDRIPAPWKETGPAYQEIELGGGGGSSSSNNPAAAGVVGRLVSRVKVATLGGQAKSIMTTRCTILTAGNDGGNNAAASWTLQVDTTKPEESTILKTLLGEALAKTVNANLLPPFPSGMALERVMPGSSQVAWQNPFCDESIRISRYGNNNSNNGDFCIWKRKEFSLYDPL